MRFIPHLRRREKCIFRQLLPHLQVLGNRMHDPLLRAVDLWKMRIMTGIENMIQTFSLDDTTGKNIKILLVFITSRDHFTMLFIMNEIPCTDPKPWRSLSMSLMIFIIVKIKQVELAAIIKRDHICQVA
ncbi:hypothetical protein SDC9_192873 [bioreactor metagenome]|uniref:Uncharacterized protein n=1 Tax=bioreactor metagenome TaxID=1076179 RepID=A0A645I363_9ZZZZ